MNYIIYNNIVYEGIEKIMKIDEKTLTGAYLTLFNRTRKAELRVNVSCNE